MEDGDATLAHCSKKTWVDRVIRFKAYLYHGNTVKMRLNKQEHL